MSSPSARSRLGSTSETSSWASSTVSTQQQHCPAQAVPQPCSAGEGSLHTGGLLDEPQGAPQVACAGVAVGGGPAQLEFSQEGSQNPWKGHQANSA